MILQKLKAYLKQHQSVSLFDLKREFGSDADVLRDMLQLWIQKGQVRCVQKTSACGVRCTKCDPLFIEIYEWMGAEGGSPSSSGGHTSLLSSSGVIRAR